MNDRLILKTICNNIKKSIHSQRRLKMVAISLKQKDIQTELLTLTKELDKIKNTHEDIEKNLLSLDKLFVRAAVSKKSSALKQLEDKLGILEAARKNMVAAAFVKARISKFSNNRAASSLKKEADSFYIITQQDVEKAEDALSRIVKTHRPIQLSNNDPLLKSIFDYIKKSFSNVDDAKKPQIDLTQSTNSIDFGQRGEIKFARYIELDNLPTMSGTKKDCYLVAVVTLKTHKTSRGKIVPINEKSFSSLSLTLAAAVIQPNSLDNLYQVTSLTKAKEVLAFMSQKFGLSVLTGEPISSTPERRRLKVAEQLKIMNNDKIKLIQDGSFFVVKVPSNLVPSDLNLSPKDIRDVSRFEKDLHYDMQRIAGIPATSRYSAGMLKKEKAEKKGRYYEWTFRLLPMRPGRDLIKEGDVAPKEDKDVISTDSREWLKTFKEDLNLQNLDSWGE